MTREKLLNLILSWENLDIITGELIRNPEDLPLLMDIALYSNHSKSWRAAWIADKIHSKDPGLILPYIESMINWLKDNINHSKKRQFLKLISLNIIPPKYYSFLLDYCIKSFTSASEPVSVKVYSMQILFNISEKESGFKPELLALIGHELELHPSAGVKSRGKMISKKLEKQIRKSGSNLI